MSTTINKIQGVSGVIGNTPLVRIVNLNPYPGVTILAKLEGSNPVDRSKTGRPNS